MENALSVPDRSVTVKDDCYILPDKTVWQFRTQNITVDSDDRWQQITAHNVTELYNGYQKQEEINKELAERSIESSGICTLAWRTMSRRRKALT